MIFGRTKDQKNARNRRPCFAWYPRLMNDGRWGWLESIMSRDGDGHFPWMTISEYTEEQMRKTHAK